MSAAADTVSTDPDAVSNRWPRRLLAGGAAAASAPILLWLGRRMPGAEGLERTNHAGRTVSLMEGPALVLAGALGSTVAGPAPVVAVLGAGTFGFIDDLALDSARKGFAGHLGALARGEITSGAVKILGIGASGLAAAFVADRRRADAPTLAATLIGGAVIAAAANIGNLLDLRPGRALKVGLITAVPLAARTGPGATAAAAAAGAAAGLLSEDLAGRTMLGDTGANALGALLGTALVERTGPRGRLVAVLLLGALTLASEKVSFTKVIESTPVLREIDQWGRAPR